MDNLLRTLRAAAGTAVVAAVAASSVSCRGATPPAASQAACGGRGTADERKAADYFVAWYTAFDVRQGAKLFLARADRVRVC